MSPDPGSSGPSTAQGVCVFARTHETLEGTLSAGRAVLDILVIRTAV